MVPMATSRTIQLCISHIKGACQKVQRLGNMSGFINVFPSSASTTRKAPWPLARNLKEKDSV
jgi:hypothetical protein